MITRKIGEPSLQVVIMITQNRWMQSAFSSWYGKEELREYQEHNNIAELTKVTDLYSQKWEIADYTLHSPQVVLVMMSSSCL